MPGRGNPLLEGPPSIFSGVNTNGTPMGFANTASTNVFTGPHVGEMPVQFANVASSVPQINDAGTTSNGMTVPTNRYPTDAQMGELYQQQRVLRSSTTI